MSRSSHRRTVKNSIPRRPHFAPQLETLESRLTPACTYYPDSQTLVGTGNDTALFYYVPASGGVDIYCNGQYAGTNLGSTTTYYAGPNSKMEIDTTLNSSGGSYLLYDYWALFGHNVNFDQTNVTDVAFILGTGSNLVNITGPSYYLTGNLPTATVVGWGPTSVVVDDSAATWNEVLAVTNNKISHYFDTLANLYSVGYVELRTGSGNDQFFVGNPGNSLGTMPLTYVKGGTGTDSITMEAADTTGEQYWFTEIGVNMANWAKDVLYYQNAENVTLNAGSGNDQITISSNSFTLAGVPPITVNGGTGTDSVTYHDTNASHGNAYNMTSTSLIAGGQATFGYSGVESLTLHAASGSNTISINSTPVGSTTTVNAGGGHDTIRVAAISGLYSDIGGPLMIDGGAGADDIGIYDSFYSSDQQYAVSPTAVAITGLPTTTFTALEQIKLYTGISNDTVTFKNPAGSLGTMSLTTVNGGAGTDSVTLESYDTTGEKYHFTELGVHMANWAKDILYYPGVENVTLKAGIGNDEIAISNNANKLENLPRITGDGGGGLDKMILNDSGWIAMRYYNLTASGLDVDDDGSGEETFLYSAVENVTLKAGMGHDGLHVGHYSWTLDGIPELIIDGGGGFDQVQFHDLENPIGNTYTLTEAQLLMPKSHGVVATFTNVSSVVLEPGWGTDIVNIAPTTGSILDTLPQCYINGVAPSTDTLNIFEHKNPNVTTYDVLAAGAGTGFIQVPAFNAQYYFGGMAVVNLFVKKGSVIDTSQYNPAHYDLNIIYRVPTPATGTSAGDPDIVNPPPLPAPPNESQLQATPAKPLPAPHARRMATVNVEPPRPMATDEIFELPFLSIDSL